MFTLTFSNLGFTTALDEYVSKVCKQNCANVDTIKEAVSLASDGYKIDSKLILAVMKVESGFKPKAFSNNNVGLMQVNLYYHQKKFKNNDYFNVYLNVLVGTSILKDCFTKHKGNHNKTFVCYNGGADKQYAAKVTKSLSELNSFN